MVGRAATVCFLLMTATAMAQEGAGPPVVSSTAPALGELGTEVEAEPVLPTASVGDPQPVASTPIIDPAGESVVVKTDLVSLVLKAHWVVQAVMGLLALAVAAVLTIFLFKVGEFALAFRRLGRAQAALIAGKGLVQMPGECALAHASRAAQREVEALPPKLTADLRASSRERLELALDRIEAGAVMRLRSGTGLLASIGAVGPFVGLFGTVFGIMNSFLAIAATKTTNLAVVAPGIAEALLATGIGLVAAIPAVLLYNAVMRRIAAYRHRLADGRAELLSRFSRELDQRMVA